ncbi:hypothetical protein PGT21_021304 [Puccinia graminis f. sp. tritici]|uniref:Uncharacterized protein n=2 Tax=Puccinia graminis f. sp. tritici TaxID=56615 RepID=E3KC63_PUCGT|nr:uncharacterized protein PGTG_08255 [Puccinia graminis f. sp. tritici CRL 75-36-700-3]EFP82006.1 hypothetical protein PGTG_08255 [Puccinia graminis f. sp. tritici CRL 75-36-700-3]KAA1117726.1 hypothetical protein PGT21_021304 [Puccinia graminis f. sp. tritici]
MFAFNQFIIIAALTLLARDSLAIECTPENIPHRPVRKGHCWKAISQIVYNSDGTLDKTSRRVNYNYGECHISFDNDLGEDVTKTQIEQGFHRLFDKCQDYNGGNTYNEDVPTHFYFGNRELGTFQAWEPDYPAGVPSCDILDGGKPITQADCVQALASIPADAHGRLVGDDYQLTDHIEKRYRSCVVNVYTSDFSKLMVIKPDVEDNLGKTMDWCHEKCGVIRIPGGAEGPNGRAYVTLRNVKRGGCQEPRTPLRTK